jgi:hypothetical protein
MKTRSGKIIQHNEMNEMKKNDEIKNELKNICNFFNNLDDTFLPTNELIEDNNVSNHTFYRNSATTTSVQMLQGTVRK